MKYLLTMLGGVEISDGLLTHFLVNSGRFQEGNPLMVPIVSQGNFLLLKVLGVLVSAVALLALYRRFPRATVLTTSSVVTFYAAVIGWNLGLFFTA